VRKWKIFSLSLVANAYVLGDLQCSVPGGWQWAALTTSQQRRQKSDQENMRIVIILYSFIFLSHMFALMYMYTIEQKLLNRSQKKLGFS
jgi:hypothetical protein